MFHCKMDGCYYKAKKPSIVQRHADSAHGPDAEECGMNGCTYKSTKNTMSKHRIKEHGITKKVGY